MKNMYSAILFCCVMGCMKIQAQNITGVWKGNYGQTLLSMHPKEVVAELFLYNDSMITGLTHAYYNRDQYEHHKISGKYYKSDSLLIFTEDSVISYWFIGSEICEGRYTMKLSKTTDKWMLSGRWKDKQGGLLACPATTVWFEKPIPGSLQEKDVPADTARAVTTVTTKDKPVYPPLTRMTDIQKVLEIAPSEKDSIAVELYDNGEVDGDSVTVYLNDSVCIAHLRLSDKPARIYVSLNPHIHIQKLTLAAENLGTIPPNTALMVVTTRSRKKYEIYLNSSMEKNAVVEFFLTN